MDTDSDPTPDEAKADTGGEVVLDTQTFDGATVKFVLIPLTAVASIDGGKTKHLMETTGARDAAGNLVYSTTEEAKEALKTVLMGEGVRITVKFDGECCVAKRIGSAAETGTQWVQFKRLDAKMRKKGKAGTKLFVHAVDCWKSNKAGKRPNLANLHKKPEGAFPVLTDEEWIATGREKRMHLVPVGTEGKKNYQARAFAKIVDHLDKLPGHITRMSFEAMGKKLHACAWDPLTELDTPDPHFLIPHGCVEVRVPDDMRTFEGMRCILAKNPQLEGFVIHTEGGQRWKFRQDGLRLTYPPTRWEQPGFAARVVTHMGMA